MGGRLFGGGLSRHIAPDPAAHRGVVGAQTDHRLRNRGTVGTEEERLRRGVSVSSASGSGSLSSSGASGSAVSSGSASGGWGEASEPNPWSRLNCSSSWTEISSVCAIQASVRPWRTQRRIWLSCERRVGRRNVPLGLTKSRIGLPLSGLRAGEELSRPILRGGSPGYGLEPVSGERRLLHRPGPAAKNGTRIADLLIWFPLV